MEHTTPMLNQGSPFPRPELAFRSPATTPLHAPSRIIRARMCQSINHATKSHGPGTAGAIGYFLTEKAAMDFIDRIIVEAKKWIDAQCGPD